MIFKKGWRSLTYLLIASVLLAVTPIYASDEDGGQAEAGIRNQFNEQELKDNDYILYFVNAGDPTPGTVEDGDKLGLYSSVTEQVYGVDPVTSKAWGLVTTTSATSVRDDTVKSGTLRYYSGSQVRDKALEYRFELPQGEYDVTFGFKNPWSGRSVNLLLEGNNVSGGDLAIGGDGTEKEVTYRKIHVADGQLNVRIQGPATAALTNHNDPLVNYLIIRLNVTVPLADLETKLNAARVEAANPLYTPYSLTELNRAIEEAEDLLEELAASGVDIAELAVQEQILAAIASLTKAIEALSINEPNASFKPGAIWRDTNGAIIQAHGGGIMYDEQTQAYYWYGEDKTNGYLPARGVRVYTSTDLYNWEDKGLALTAIESLEDFDTDPLISELYAGRADREDILNDIGTNRIIERPKVIYNDATGKYVMWMHTDGPSATSTANYAKAEAGYALSDSPTGPFVYQESHRMDRAPKGATDDGQPNQPGMARDMTLFKDDDGTAYLIYSSEENLTIYISRLNESYTDVVGWHRDGSEERDTEYKAVYGEDYVRVFPLAQREAPAMFKYQGKYYMITSGATGWDPNVGKYTVADEIFGEWKPMRDVAPGSATTFGSQSTHVIPVDAAAGKFIYMGDRWNKNDLANSRYVWLPIEFGQNDEIVLRWHDEWTLDALDSMGRVTVNTPLPAHTTIGVVPELPASLNVTLSDGTTRDTPVTWQINELDYRKPGPVLISGVMPQLANKNIEHQLYVIPAGSAYFVHAGGANTADYAQMVSLIGEDNLRNGAVIDQQYNPAGNQTWGYVGDHTSPSGTSSGDLFSSLRYLKSNSGDDLTYLFELENGDYDVYVGLYDPWAQYSNGNRKADIVLNGITKTSSYVFSASRDVLGYGGVSVQDGKLELTVRRSANAGASSSDPQISWIIITESKGGVVDPPPGPDAELLLHYDMSHIEGAVVKDQTGRYDGAWVNAGQAEWMKTEGAGAVSFAGGSVSSYIEIPQGVLDGLTDVTVSALVNWGGARTAEWLFALGQNDTHYLYMTPKYNSDGTARAGIATNGWRNEASTRGAALASGSWKLVTVVMSGTDNRISLYMDGALVSSSPAGGFTLESISQKSGISGYIGKSFYTGDPSFGGMVADFQIYDGALQAAEIGALQTEADKKRAALNALLLNYEADQLVIAELLGQNVSAAEITSSLTLPTAGKYGTAISWASSNESVIDVSGKVNRPSYTAQDEAVTLTASLTDGASTVARSFAFTVLKREGDFELAARDAAALIIHNVNDIRGNITLPTTGSNGSSISWNSEEPAIIATDGVVNRPAAGAGDTSVRLTAAITKNDIVITKGFLATVRELPEPEENAGYVFAYFTGEGRVDGEQVYFAVSSGNDPLNWSELNDGKPVLTSSLGEQGVRDPFLIRSPEGDKFYLIATDLKIYGNNDWTRAQTKGSRSIMVWESTDLVHWSEQRMVEVAPEEAGNTWAPEVAYDESSGEYIVFWASKLYEDASHSGSAYQRILYAKTRDFHTFTEPAVYLDYGYSIIDTTMITYDGSVYRFTKDERGHSEQNPNGKFVFQEQGGSIFDPSFTLTAEGIGKGDISRGEGPTIFKSNTEQKWYLFIDEFGGAGYVPFETTDLSSGVWTKPEVYQMPDGSRHGTVIPVTRSEYQLLQSTIPGIEEPDTDHVRVTGLSLAPAQLTLKEGDVQQLTATITPADASNKSVLWSSSREDIVKVDETGRLTALKEGSAVITAASADGGFIAVSRLTVEKIPASGGGTDPGTSPGNGGNPGNGSNPGGGTNPGSNNGSGGGTDNGEEGSGAEAPSFNDTNGHWAAAAIRRLAEKGILGGFPDGSFKPDKQMSRAEFAAVMFRMLGLDAIHADSAFTDVAQNAWYSEYVNGLYAAGYVNGFEDGGFRPNQPLTREEAFVILYRAMKGRLAAAETSEELSFRDGGAVSDWAQEAVKALATAGMIKGYADGSLKPKSTITRAEIAAIAAAFLDLEQ